MSGWPWLERGTSETTECDVMNRWPQGHAGSGVSLAALSPTPATQVEKKVFGTMYFSGILKLRHAWY